MTNHAVVEGVFSKRTSKEKRRLNVLEGDGQRVVNDVSANAEFDRIMTGTHDIPIPPSFNFPL